MKIGTIFVNNIEELISLLKNSARVILVRESSKLEISLDTLTKGIISDLFYPIEVLHQDEKVTVIKEHIIKKNERNPLKEKVKRCYISHRITDHDLFVKINWINKSLLKGYQIHVILDNLNKGERAKKLKRTNINNKLEVSDKSKQLDQIEESINLKKQKKESYEMIFSKIKSSLDNSISVQNKGNGYLLTPNIKS